MGQSEPEVRDRVYRYLRLSIVTGEMRVGARLVEDQISAELGVSRTPVREAIQRLTSEALVRRVRRGHVEVRHISQQERVHLHLLRLAYDEIAATLITDHVDTIDWEVIEARLADLTDAVSTHGLGSSAMAIAHLDFHLAINRAAFGPDTTPLMISQSFVYVIDLDSQPTGYDPVAQHRELLDSLRSGDLDRVLRTTRSHAVLLTGV